MDFPAALTALFAGAHIRRTAWDADAFLIDVPGSGIYVEADRPLGKAAPELVGETINFSSHVDVYIDGQLVPWTPNQTDLHAADWETR